MSPQVLAEVADLPSWSPQTRQLVAEYQVQQGLRALIARVPNPGVTLNEATVSPDGSEVELTVRSVRELSSWYEVVPRATASAAGRCERRVDGQLYALGGMQWRVSLPEVADLPGVRVTLWAESGELEELPDTTLVRHLCPWEARRRAIREREAAAARRAVAA
ncbi:hypothetical protein [Kitasatospora sp. NPDC056731]|uniref:hypothetical protein n=1 Tax=Kitasatospora sp. NPDC056731 TaxID=3155422 RepID=UPI0034271E8D